MEWLLLALATLILIYAGFGRPLSFLIPALGVHLWYQSHRVRRLISLFGVASAVAAVFLSPSPGVIVWACLLIPPALLPWVLVPERLLMSLDRTRHVSADEAGWKEDEAVIGTVIRDQPVAWNMNRTVIPRHMVNDTIFGERVFVSYCALCASGLIFDGTVDGLPRTFYVAGVWRRNMVIKDHERGTLWQQGTGQALMGPDRGCQMPMRISWHMPWGEWKKAHPTTWACLEAADAPQPIVALEKIERMLRLTRKIPTFGKVSVDQELDGVEVVFGIALDGESRAWPLERLKQAAGGERMEFTARLGSHELTLTYVPAQEQLYVRESGSNEPVIVERHWWRGWKEFHPQSDIWAGHAAPARNLMT